MPRPGTNLGSGDALHEWRRRSAARGPPQLSVSVLRSIFGPPLASRTDVPSGDVAPGGCSSSQLAETRDCRQGGMRRAAACPDPAARSMTNSSKWRRVDVGRNVLVPGPSLRHRASDGRGMGTRKTYRSAPGSDTLSRVSRLRPIAPLPASGGVGLAPVVIPGYEVKFCGSLPPLAASSAMTFLCSQTFIAAESLKSPE